MYSNKRAKTERGASKSNAKEQWSPRQLCRRHREQLVQIGAGAEEGSKRDASELEREKRETDYLMFNWIRSLRSVGKYGAALMISVLKIRQNEIIINFGENKLLPKKKV